MDRNLLAWGRAVKARQRRRWLSGRGGWPVLWLFTDPVRLPDPLPVIARLPAKLCGVVLRQGSTPDEIAGAERIAALCRRRRIALVVAGDWRLAARLHGGLHRRRGRGRAVRGRAVGARGRLVTSSAHDRVELLRAVSNGASLIFLSPCFPTSSHPGAAALGPRRWTDLARRSRVPVLALGGVDGATARRLPLRHCAGAGAIGAWQ